MSLPIIETIQTNIENLKNTKQNIKNAVNTDYDFIANEQIESYPGLIKQGIAHYKNRVPHAIKEGTDLSFNGVPLKFDNMTIKGNTEQATRILPEGYTALDYIESTGTQYIDTGRFSTPNTKFEMDYSSNKKEGETFQCLFGSQNGTLNRRSYMIIGSEKNNVQLQFSHAQNYPLYMQNDGTFSGTPKNTDTILNTDVKTRIIFDNIARSVTVGQYTSVSSGTYEILPSNYNILIFARNNSSAPSSHFAAGKLYRFKWYENNVLTMDFVPCKNSNNEVGLYDLVSQTFFGNAGTEDFVAGNEVTIPNPDYPQPIHVVTGENTIKICGEGAVELPNGYTQVNYIESSQTQYIDTGFKLNQNTKVEMDYHYVDDGNDKHNYSAFGVNGMFVITSSNTSPMGFKYNETKYNTNISTYVRHKVKFDRNKAYVDDVLIKTFTEATFQADYNAILFARVVNSTGEIEEKTKMRLYSCKIYDNDVLIRDYIPCFRNNDNEIGLYDLVNNTFYMNSGTGSFTYGSIVVKQNYPLNLGSLELCKIGDYQDYIYKNGDNWYKYEAVKKIILNGTEKGWRQSGAASCVHNIPLADILPTLNNNSVYNNGISDKFKNGISYAQISSAADYSNYYNRMSATSDKYLSFSYESTTSIALWKQWLSNNNVTAYFVLETPTSTQITDSTLIAQLNAIDKAKGVDGTTIITIDSDDLKPILNFTAYLKEAE